MEGLLYAMLHAEVLNKGQMEAVRHCYDAYTVNNRKKGGGNNSNINNNNNNINTVKSEKFGVNDNDGGAVSEGVSQSVCPSVWPNLVYVAPTSGGKSLVSELVVLRRVLFEAKKALIVLPYVSLCEEKTRTLRRLWECCGVRVDAFYSGQGLWSPSTDVCVCTIEKANLLITRLYSADDAMITSLGVVIVDEVHLIADDQRGFLLEVLLMKLMRLKKLGLPIQVLAMSATLPNAQELSKWMDARVYVTTTRTTQLTSFVKCNHTVYSLDTTHTHTNTHTHTKRRRLCWTTF
eukprot:GHVR01134180.1.p1 GENE.GHVR01134180.1~~GHVR01134180.1.p1  ORF type:complete len:291 (+),score=100.13 GHVR01134180.1:169-1041(+)